MRGGFDGRTLLRANDEAGIEKDEALRPRRRRSGWIDWEAEAGPSE